MIIEKSIIRNASIEATIPINSNGKFQLTSPSGKTSAVGEFTSVESGRIDYKFSFKIVRSTGPNCRLSYELKRLSLNSMNPLIIKKNQPIHVITLNMQRGICKNNVLAYDTWPKPKNGTTTFKPVNSDQCTFELIYTPITNFTGDDHLSVVLPSENESPFRRIIPFALHVK